MTLLDSNIVIYAAGPKGQAIREFLIGHTLAVSAISLVEVLGFHRLGETERGHLGDSLIAATALIHGLPLMTRNTKDFAALDGLQLLNPFSLGL